MSEAKDLIDALDHLADAKCLLEAVFMAARALGPEESSAIALVASIAQDRLNEAETAIRAVQEAKADA